MRGSVVQKREEDGLSGKNAFTVVLTWGTGLQTVAGATERFVLISNPKWSFHNQLF